MKNKSIIVIIATFIIATMACNVYAANELVDKKNELVYIKSQIEQAQYAIDQINEKSNAVSKEIEEIDSLVESTQSEIDKIQSEIDDKKDSLDVLKYQKENNNKKLEMAKQSFKEVSQKIIGEETDYWKWAAQTDSPTQYNLRILQLINVYDVYDKALDVNSSKQTDIRSKEGLVSIEKQKLESNKQIVVSKQNFIKEQLDKKTALLNNLSNQKNNFDDTVSDLESSSKELTNIISTLQASGAGYSSSLAKGKGIMIWPTNGGRITSPFGDRTHPIEGKVKHHDGIDIGIPEGTPVFATQDGVVIESGWVSGYGNTVIIDHGNKVSTLYGHNSKLLVKSGDVVKKGQQISKSGNTGNSTGPHLHYEIRQNGTPVNPMDWL